MDLWYLCIVGVVLIPLTISTLVQRTEAEGFCSTWTPSIPVLVPDKVYPPFLKSSNE